MFCCFLYARLARNIAYDVYLPKWPDCFVVREIKDSDNDHELGKSSHSVGELKMELTKGFLGDLVVGSAKSPNTREYCNSQSVKCKPMKKIVKEFISEISKYLALIR